MAMTLIVAYVRRSRRVAVTNALRAAGVDGWTECMVTGHGRAAGGHEVESLRLEIVVPAHGASDISSVIAKVADTGSPGDGVVLTLDVASAQRLGHGHRGDVSTGLRPQ